MVWMMLLVMSVSGAVARDWNRAQDDFKFVKGELNYFNRSACAKKSLEPTKSVFVIVDNVNIAKSIYRLAKIKKIDPVSTTNLGIEKFRYTLASLIKMISGKILTGELPLLRDEKILKDCEQGNCSEMNQYLDQQWRKSKTILDDKLIQCKVVKKFSTLHSYLRVSKPDRVLLEEMAKELQHSEDFVTNCSDFSDVSQPEVALYQFDVSAPDNFKEIGFAFWHTLKIYLSWSFRNAPEMTGLAYPFDYLFQSANLEEMVLFFSNGCESISPTSCSDNDLNLENLRYLTETSNTIDWTASDYIRPVPSATPDDLFSKPLPVMEDDLLNLGDFKTSDEWVKNFRDNFVRTRGYNKVKLSRASSNLSLITENLSVDQMIQKIDKDIKELSPQGKQGLYYLCSEYSVASDKDLSIIRKDLYRLKDLKIFDQVLKDISDKNMEIFWNYFEDVSLRVNQVCADLKQREIWNDEFLLKKEGFSPWYQQLVYEKKITPADDLTLSYDVAEKPFLKITDGAVICQNGVHCARLVLDSMMSLSAISHSLSSLVPQKEILSNNMGNPYSGRMSCGAYDPWAKKNKIIFDFFQDMAQTAIFGFIPTPVYVGATLDPKRVVSFETLIKEGQVFYDPKFNSHRLKLALMADLGPLIGVPCSVSVSGTKLNPFQYYMFNGISFSGCRERSKTDVVVSSGDDSSKEGNYRQACATCAINLQTIASSASLFNPAFRVSFFLIKGIVRLISQLKDPHDLAHDWTISPHQVALSYRYHGEISQKCAKKLLKGKSCLDKRCERKMMEEITSYFDISPTQSDFSCFSWKGTLHVKECKEPIHLSYGDNLEIESTCALKVRK